MLQMDDTKGLEFRKKTRVFAKGLESPSHANILHDCHKKLEIKVK